MHHHSTLRIIPLDVHGDIPNLCHGGNATITRGPDELASLCGVFIKDGQLQVCLDGVIPEDLAAADSVLPGQGDKGSREGLKGFNQHSLTQKEEG